MSRSGGNGAARARSRSTDSARQPNTLLAGNANVSLSPAGQPVATLVHPRGGSCQVLLGAARVISWKTPDGVERIAACEDDSARALGGLGPAGLPFASWDIEALTGAESEDGLKVSVFAESSADSAVSSAARATFSLRADGQLSVDLEVSNTADEPMEGEASAPRLDLSSLRMCGNYFGPADASSPAPAVGGPAVAALGNLGLTLRLEGFEVACTVESAVGLSERIGRPCRAFELATAEPLSLLPGQTLEAGIAVVPAAVGATA